MNVRLDHQTFLTPTAGQDTLLHLELRPPCGEKQNRGAGHHRSLQGLCFNSCLKSADHAFLERCQKKQTRFWYKSYHLIWSCLTNLHNKGIKRSRQEINADYFYGLLFTRSVVRSELARFRRWKNPGEGTEIIEIVFFRLNLKLVHIVCHDKGCHKGKVCDKTQFYQWQYPKQNIFHGNLWIAYQWCRRLTTVTGYQTAEYI